MKNIKGLAWRLIAVWTRFAQPLLLELTWWFTYSSGDGVWGWGIKVFRFPHQFHALMWAFLVLKHKVWLCSKILTNLQIRKYGSRLSVSVHPFPSYSRRKVSPHCFTTITLEAEKHSCCDDRTDTQQATYLSQAYTETYLYKAPTWRLYLSLAALLGFWVRNYFCASR